MSLDVAKGDAAAWLLGGRDEGEEAVDTVTLATALALLRVVMPPGVSRARAGFWGWKTNAPSPLTQPLRTPDGEFRDGLPTSLVHGFPLTMVDLDADPAGLVDALRIPLPGLEDLLEWPEYLHLRETGTRLWLSPDDTRALVVAPPGILEELARVPSLVIRACEEDVTGLVDDLTRQH